MIEIMFSLKEILEYAAVIVILSLEISHSVGKNLVKTDKGKVKGFTQTVLGKQIDTFYGIPFAKPPIGDLRFKHPQPMDNWRGIFNATQKPNSCIQLKDDTYGNFSGSQMWNANTPVSEDCLYLNLWAPRTKPKQRLAVIVWIYGGSFLNGASSLDIYDGRILAAKNDIIIVSMNYRTGMLGFLAMGTAEAPGNAGLFDQQMALEWVQKNIKYFGGDPKNVCLMGESAGSVSVSMHLLSPLSKEKFSRAIMQSGTAVAQWATIPRQEAINRGLRAAEELGCRQDDESVDEIIECLKRVDPLVIAKKEYITIGIIQFPFVPIVDGSFFIEHPAESLRTGSFKKCPILLGSNVDEGSYFLIYQEPKFFSKDHPSTLSREDFENVISRLFYYYPNYPRRMNSFGLDAILFQYTPWINPEDGELNRNNIDDAVGDLHFVCSVNKFAEEYARRMENVYYYYFVHRSSMNPWHKWMGVMHADEINYVFGEPFQGIKNYEPLEVQLSENMMRYWTNFAKTGDPNKGADGNPRLGEWPIHTPDGKEYLTLHTDYIGNSDKAGAIGAGPRAKYCAFWNEYLPSLVELTSKGNYRFSTDRECPDQSAIGSSATRRRTSILIVIALLVVIFSR